MKSAFVTLAIGMMALLGSNGALAQSTAATDQQRRFTIDLQPGMSVIDHGTAQPSAIMVSIRSPESGASIGLCFVMRDANADAVEMSRWAETVTRAFAPAAFAQELTGKQGHRWIRTLSSKPFVSRTGWQGYMHVVERANRDTGIQQTAVMGGTMLNAETRILLQCATPTTGGAPFSPADLGRIERMFTSVRLP
ncbi:MAG: hypothetical protein ACK4RV_13475 [Caulobacter sp.]